MAFWDSIHAPRRADWGGSTMSDNTANDSFYARPAPVRAPAPAAPAAPAAPPVDEDGGLRGAMGQALGGYEGETVPGGNPHADRAYWDAVNGRGAAYYGGGQSTDPSWVRNPIHDYEGGTNFVGPTMDELLGVGARPIQMPARAPGRRRRRAGTGTAATPISNRDVTPSASEAATTPLIVDPYAAEAPVVGGGDVAPRSLYPTATPMVDMGSEGTPGADVTIDGVPAPGTIGGASAPQTIVPPGSLELELEYPSAQAPLRVNRPNSPTNRGQRPRGSQADIRRGLKRRGYL